MEPSSLWQPPSSLPLRWGEAAWGGYAWLVAQASPPLAQLELDPRGALRATSAGVLHGSLSLSWGRGALSSGSMLSRKHVLLGESAWERGTLPDAPVCESADAISLGACADGFEASECECAYGAIELPFMRVVEPGELVQVAAVPEEYGGTDVPLRATLSLSYRPGGWCDWLSDAAATGGQCSAKWDGVDLPQESNGCYTEVARQALDGRIELASSNCHISLERNHAPFLYQTVPSGTAFTATVRVQQSADVQWNAGGLMLRPAHGEPVTADTQWAGVFSAQARMLTVQGAQGGSPYVSEQVPQPRAGPVWLRVRRSTAGELRASWRMSAQDEWNELGAPFEISALSGDVYIGVAQHSSSSNVGAVSLDSYELQLGESEGAEADHGVCCLAPGRAGTSRVDVSHPWTPFLIVCASVFLALFCLRRPADEAQEDAAFVQKEAALSRGWNVRKGGLPTGSDLDDIDSYEKQTNTTVSPSTASSYSTPVKNTTGRIANRSESGRSTFSFLSSIASFAPGARTQLGYAPLNEERGNGFGTPTQPRNAGAVHTPVVVTTPTTLSGALAFFRARAESTYAEIVLGSPPHVGGHSVNDSPAIDARSSTSGPIRQRLATACAAVRSMAGLGGSESSSAFVARSNASHVEIRFGGATAQ